jgi:hypothetical protein
MCCSVAGMFPAMWQYRIKAPLQFRNIPRSICWHSMYSVLGYVLAFYVQIPYSPPIYVQLGIMRPVSRIGYWRNVAEPSNLNSIQTLQSRIHRKITNALFMFPTLPYKKNLNILFVHDLAIESHHKFHNKLYPHIHKNSQHITSHTTLPDNGLETEFITENEDNGLNISGLHF